MKELRKEIESKLQFIIVLALFFPSLMEALFDENSARTLTLKWATVVVFLILNYLYLNILKPDLTKRMAWWVDLFLDLNVFLYIPLICAFTPIVTTSSSILFTKIVTSYRYIRHNINPNNNLANTWLVHPLFQFP